MARKTEPIYRFGEYWLGKRSGKKNWFRCWYSVGSGRTERASLGTDDLEEAKIRLRDWYFKNHGAQDDAADQILLCDVIRIYYEDHARKLRSHEAARIGLTHWINFFEATETVESATTPQKIDRFIEHLQEDGRSPAYINRILTSGRAAINRAWKKGMITSAPFIRSLEVGETEPKGRPLSLDELRHFYHLAETPHLRAFILWGIATAARPEAVQLLHSDQIDQDAGIINLNPLGRKQTKKHRPTVKLPPSIIPFIVPGYQVAFRGQPPAEIKTSWRKQRAKCKLDDKVNPYSLRHTIARYLRASGVPAWQVSSQLGHKKKDLSTTEIYAPHDPSYLSASVDAIDQFLKDLLVEPSEDEMQSWHLRGTPEASQNSQIIDFIGAGDEIRTHDPNLGKVVLYP